MPALATASRAAAATDAASSPSREHGGIVQQRRDRIAPLVHERDARPGHVPRRQLDRLADLIDPSVAAADAIGDLQPGIAERAGQGRAQSLGLMAIAEIDHQAGARPHASSAPTADPPSSRSR